MKDEEEQRGRKGSRWLRDVNFTSCTTLDGRVSPVILAIDLPVEALVSGGDDTAQLDQEICDHF